MNHHSACKKQRMDEDCRMSIDSSDDRISVSSTETNDMMELGKSSEHSIRIMHGLNKLKKEKVLCDVTLIAEGELIKPLSILD